MRFVRYVVLLLTIALIGPSAAAVLANGADAGRVTVPVNAAAPPVPGSALMVVSSQSVVPGVRGVTEAPAAFSLGTVEFSLQKGDNATPVFPETRFRFGARQIWAFWSYSGAKPGQVVNYVLRFGSTDVAWGSLPVEERSGRMEVALERLDGDYLMIGTFRLFLDAAGGDSGDVRAATFEIYDDSAPGNDNGGDNGNGNDNGGGDNGNDNGGSDNGNDNF